jgi:hypothetical protein
MYGYYIPDVYFMELLDWKYFAKPVFFNYAKFYRGASFSGSASGFSCVIDRGNFAVNLK